MTSLYSSNIKSDLDRVIALAGILQSAYLVDQIASKGMFDSSAFSASIHSLFQFDANTTADVYGGIEGVKCGLKILNNILSVSSFDNYRPTIRYSLAILHLQNKVSKDEKTLSTIRRRLEHTSIKADHYTENVNEIAASCASVYQDTISSYKYRIQINGNIQQLQNTTNVDKIRALLLAGIRSAVLWRQLGGRRWNFVFSRKRMLKAAEELLQ